MTVVRNRRVFRPLTILGLLALVLVSFSPLLRSSAWAQLDNNQPTQAFASVVDCIRTGADLGQPSYVAPRLITTCYGSRWNDGGYTSSFQNLSDGDSNPTDPAVVTFGDGQPDVAGSEPGHVPTANLGQVGSVYGVAYSTGSNPSAPAGSAQQKRTFVGAYTKRLTRYGALGPGGIYVMNNSTGAVSGYVTVPNVVPGPNGAPYDPGDGSTARFPNDPAGNVTYTPAMGGLHRPNSDINMADFVGRTALGDIDLDAEERYLYAVNLNTKRVVRFDTWSANPQATYTELPAMPLLSNAGACNNSGASGPQDLHPFGLKVTSFGVYLGFTCTAKSSQNRNDLAAGVVRYNFNNGTWTLALWSNGGAGWGLTAFDAQRGSYNGMSQVWQPWRTVNVGGIEYDPQPILANIDFAANNTMVLGFRDRFGDMGHSGRYAMETQSMAAGDTLVAPFNTTSNTWNVPVSTGAEYFDDETDFVHNEATWGGMTYIPGRRNGSWGGEIATTVVHPYRNNSAGAAWFNMEGGRATAKEELYLSSTGTQSFSKSAGLGDLEVECAWRSIGNRVWRDSNGNGIQDAGEPTINGVRLQLTDMSDNVLATITTGSLDNADDNFRFYVNPFTTYKIKIDPTMFAAGQPLAGLHVSMHDQGGNDTLDNDMFMGNNTIVVPAGFKGENNLTYDIGLTDQPRIGDRVWNDANGNGIQDAGEPGIDGAVVELLNNSGQVIDTSTTVLGGYYGFTIAPNTTYTTRLRTSNFVAGGPLAGLILAPRDRGGNDQTDSDADQLRRSIAIPGQPAGAMNFSFDFGVMGANLANGSVGDFVWNDNGNGVQDSGELGIPNVTVRLINTADGSVAGSTATGANGAYVFNNVIPGTYVVEFVPPSGATAPSKDAGGDDTKDSDADAASSWRTPPFEVIQDTTITTLDQGFILPADVSMTKTGPASGAAGGNVTYTLAYSNAGPGFATNVVVVDTLPTGLTFVSANPAPASQSGQTVSWNLGTLSAGTNGTISLVAKIAADAPASITNTATISTDTPDPTPGNNPGDSPPLTVTRPNVGIEKTGPASANVGTQVSYTLAYTNTGNGTATAATVTDTLPAGLTFVSAQPAPTSQNGQTVSWNVGDLDPGATGSITLVAQISGSATGAEVVNETRLTTAAVGDPDPSNDTDTATTALTRPNVGITKDGPATAAAGGTYAYTLAYSNTGDGAASGVMVTDTLPAGLTFVSATPAPTSTSGQTLTWNIGNMAAGANGSISLQVRLATSATPGSTITNTARISTTSSGDTDPTNDTGTATTTVAQQPNVNVSKIGPATANAGSQVSYVLDYGNSGGADAASVVVRDTLPAGLTFVSAQPAPANVTGQVLTWNLNTIPASATGRITVVAQLASSATSGSTVVNNVVISTTTPGDNPDDNTGTATTTVTTATAIQLAYFKAERGADGVHVRWGTLSEQDTKEFKILRGATNDRAKAVEIGTVASKGSQGSDYSWTDANAPTSGMLYYWLVEVENGGAQTPYGPAMLGRHTIYLPTIVR